MRPFEWVLVAVVVVALATLLRTPRTLRRGPAFTLVAALALALVLQAAVDGVRWQLVPLQRQLRLSLCQWHGCFDITERLGDVG